MIDQLVVDRNVSEFLSVYDFVQFRKTCRLFYADDEAWQRRAKHLPIHNNDPKKRIGLHYILRWSTQWNVIPGSLLWYQRIVNWLQYKISIKIVFSFIRSQNVRILKKLNFEQLSARQRWHWEYLCHRNQRLFKTSVTDYDVRPVKRHRSGISGQRIVQPCVC